MTFANGESLLSVRRKINLSFAGSYTELLANTDYTYTAGSGYSVSSGDVIETNDGGFWEVAASGASDHHATTAGGVKLYEAGPNFSTRARLVAAHDRNVAASRTVPGGTVWTWPDLSVVLMPAGHALYGTDPIADLAGWVWSGSVSNLHFADNTTPGTTDMTDAIQSAVAAGGDVVIEGGVLLVTKTSLEALTDYGIKPAAGANIRQAANTWITLESGVDVRHVVVGAGGDDDVSWDGFKFDGQSSECNGLGASGVDGWSLTGDIRLKNITSAAQSTSAAYPYLGGGRGITFQGGCTNISIGVIRAYNCFQALDMTGKPSNDSYTNSCVGIIAEECDIVYAAVGTDTQGEVGGDDNSGVHIGFIQFLNCGKSSQDNRLNFSFKRVEAAGNSWPWQTVNRPTTSYTGTDYVWEIATYNASHAEWSAATGSYAINDTVKFTNNGEYSSVIAVSHAGGVTIGSVSGKNDGAYGTIGALLWGMGKNVRIGGGQVDIDCNHLVRCGANPYLGVLTRPYSTCEYITVDNVRNVGVTDTVVDSDGPTSTTYAYGAPGLMMRGIEIFETGNSAIVGDNLRDQPGSSSDRGYRGYVEVFNIEKGGKISGLLDQIGYAAISDVNGAFSGAFKDIHLGPLVVAAYQSSNQFRIQRLGSSSGYVDLYVNGSDFILKNSSGTDLFRFETDTGDLRVLTDGAGFWLTQPDGTAVELTADNSGRLLIDGTVVGTQT
jgi:hypothetical protein